LVSIPAETETAARTRSRRARLTAGSRYAARKTEGEGSLVEPVRVRPLVRRARPREDVAVEIGDAVALGPVGEFVGDHKGVGVAALADE
jgi:hypothetical protein